VKEQNNKKITEIKINTKWCKGCGICVEFCHQKVFVMKNGKPDPVNSEKCTRCMLCEIRCPDYAITVGGDEDGE
jgi:2-oxoglutarate ferredoxin oxidoreductase subunit delta